VTDTAIYTGNSKNTAIYTGLLEYIAIYTGLLKYTDYCNYTIGTSSTPNINVT
jgi:hypothetical protein